MPPQTSEDPVAALQAALSATAGPRSLTIGRDHLGDPLFDHWQDCLAIPEPGLALTGATVSDLDSAGWFTVTGAAKVAGAPTGDVTLTFFAAVNAADGTRTLESTLAFAAFPATWRATDAFDAMPSYVHWGQSSTSLEPSFFALLELTNARASYSSFDFAANTAAGTPPPFTTTAPSSPAAAAGLSLSGTVTTTDAPLWEPLKGLLPETIDVAGLVGSPHPGAPPQIELRHDTGPSPPKLAVPGVGGVSIELGTVSISSGLASPGGPDPRLAVDVRLVGCSPELDAVLELPVGAATGSLTATLEPPVDLGEWLHRFGLQPVAANLPSELDTLALSALTCTFTLDPPTHDSVTIDSVTIAVRPVTPWILIEGQIAVDPTFVLGLGASDYVEFDAVWYLGDNGCQLIASGRSPDGDVSIALAPGHELDAGALFDELLPGAYQPSLTLVDLVVDGNFVQKTFSFQAETGDLWSIDVHETAIAVTDVLVIADWSPDDGFDATLSGVLKIGAYSVSMALALADDSIEFDVSVPELNVSDLVEHALHGVSLPGPLADFDLHDLALQVRPREGWLHAHAGSWSPVKLLEGFSFAVASLDVIRDPATGVSASLDLTLDLGGTTIGLAGGYAHGTWTFTGSCEQPIAIGHLLHSLEQQVGLDYPLPTDGLSVATLLCTVELGSERAFAFSCELDGSGGKYGTFAFLARERTADQWDYVLVAVPNVAFHFTELPVVGDDFKALGDPGVSGLSLRMASRDMTAEEVDELARLDPEAGISGAIAGGATLSATLDYGAGTEPVAVPLTTPARPPAAQPPALRAAAAVPAEPSATKLGTPAPSGITRWFPVNRTFGPVTLSQVGVRYDNGALLVELDAGLALGGFQLAVEGLGIGSRLDHLEVVGSLDGLSVAFAAGPVELSGGLYRQGDGIALEPVEYEYLGELSIGIRDVQVTGIGAFARIDDSAGTGHPAFFAFVEVSGEFGGPPAFFITGFMGGLGCNYSLTLPTPDQVSKFPFLAAFGDTTVFGPDPTPTSVLETLTGQGGKTPWVEPSYGTFWGAAGILFRSFELVLGRALVVVTVGRDIDIALLGVASASLPQGESERYAYIELQLEAVIEPDQGFFGVLASLTPSSFLLTEACHLTGGFAFCLWFGPSRHAGDFVVSVGGYHPAFAKPDWYPAVAPVGFTWVVSSEVVVHGSAYFALTPAAAMAGGSLEVTYQSGDLKAWLIAWTNILITWKPFHFDITIGISVGASYRLQLGCTTTTLSVELGASLKLWGPPTGGEAHVHWFIVSFTVAFGAGQSGGADQTLDWAGIETLLPGHSADDGTRATTMHPRVLTVHAADGLTSQDKATGMWTVRADELAFTTASAVPASAITQGRAKGASAPLGTQPAVSGIDIRPMNLPAVSSTHEVTVTDIDAPDQPLDLTGWAPQPQALNMPGSLWGKPLNGANPPASADTVESATGVRLTAPPAQAHGLVGPLAVDKIVDPLPDGPAVLATAGQAAQIPAAAADKNSLATVAAAFGTSGLAATQAAQAQVLAVLGEHAAAPAATGLAVKLGTGAGTQFSQPPMTVAG